MAAGPGMCRNPRNGTEIPALPTGWSGFPSSTAAPVWRRNDRCATPCFAGRLKTVPRVFVGIPTFNRPDLVRDAIASVRAQSFSDYRVLVSDNCSSAEAAGAVRQYVAGLNDARFAFYQQSVNEGEYGQGRLFFAESVD